MQSRCRLQFVSAALSVTFEKSLCHSPSGAGILNLALRSRVLRCVWVLSGRGPSPVVKGGCTSDRGRALGVHRSVHLSCFWWRKSRENQFLRPSVHGATAWQKPWGRETWTEPSHSAPAAQRRRRLLCSYRAEADTGEAAAPPASAHMLLLENSYLRRAVFSTRK